jgi:two-component system, chemotaxis family, chemotaxis protein CheY
MPIRALSVDDSSIMGKIVERSLHEAGVDLSTVFQTGNGHEALVVLQESAVDLILCDIDMPVVDGLKFIKQLAGVATPKAYPWS